MLTARLQTFINMNYLPRPVYEAIARAVGPGNDLADSVHAAIEAHRLLDAAFTSDASYTPRELAFVQALRAHLNSSKHEVKVVPDIAKIEDAPVEEVTVVELPTPPIKRKKS